MKNIFLTLLIVAGVLTLLERIFPAHPSAAQIFAFVQESGKKIMPTPTMKLVGFYGDEEQIAVRKSQAQQTQVSAIEDAYVNHHSNVQVESFGVVERILSDDNEGNQHQRFIVRINSAMTVLVAHNIDLAQRIADIKVGEAIYFYGEYEWNQKGGAVHWTHHDPNGRHLSGWLKYHGVTYQ